ncbi:MAG TPA: hypothetical protein GX745_07275 [Clostridiales bacterium]|nr:hypothetical protein [Clostridiales bacterium]
MWFALLENLNQELTDNVSPEVEEACFQLYELFRGLTKVGFNDEQALEIVIRMLLQNLK